MKIILIVSVFFASLFGPAFSEEIPDRDEAIANVVTNQLAAFSANDPELAFSFASPAIKKRFLNADTFIKMVKRSYSMIHDPSVFQLEDVIEESNRIFQVALFVGKKSRTVKAYYEMQKHEDGTWRINGVYLQESQDEFI